MPLKIIRQDITKIECDAIVNATNMFLIPGGHGVDAAIHSVSGELLDEECKKIGGVDVGKAVMTNAYNLPCKKIIHTAGPIWMGGNDNETELLISCYNESLKLARDGGFESIAFPLISSGTYGFPKDKVLKIAVDTVSAFLADCEMTVYIAVYDKESFSIGQSLYDGILDYISETPADTDICKAALLDCELMPNYDIDMSRLGFMPARKSPPKVKPKVNAPINPEKNALRIKKNAIKKAHTDSTLNDLKDFIMRLDETFSLRIQKLIDTKGMTDIQCYKKANVSRQTWHKIIDDESYRPSKNTVIQFAFALELSTDETIALLATAGFTLSRSIRFDCIILYFLEHKKYDIYEVDEALLKFDQVPLSGI